MSSIATVVAYSTDSAGMHPSHNLALKLRAISEAGFTHVELAFPDLEAYAEQEYPGYQKLDASGRGDIDKLCSAAGDVRALCQAGRMKILAVHPFSKFEGYEDANRRAQGFERAAAWFRVLKALDCQMLQVGSSDDPSTSPDYETIARDLRQLADEAAAQKPPIKIAYEMWAWGVHVNTWQHTWKVCKLVDRPNFGLCLDTFQICARAYADPTQKDGLGESATASLKETLDSLSKTIPPKKIFYFQISDGSRLVSPSALLSQGIPPLYAWSNAWRPLPFMDELVSRDHGNKAKGKQGWGGYLPVVEVCEAVVKTGWRGPWSYEVFFEEDMGQDDPDVPARWASTARKSHDRIEEILKARGY